MEVVQIVTQIIIGKLVQRFGPGEIHMADMNEMCISPGCSDDIGKFTRTRRELGAQYSRIKTVRTQIKNFDRLQTCSHGPFKFLDMTFKFQMFSNDILNVYK